MRLPVPPMSLNYRAASVRADSSRNSRARIRVKNPPRQRPSLARRALQLRNLRMQVAHKRRRRSRGVLGARGRERERERYLYLLSCFPRRVPRIHADAKAQWRPRVLRPVLIARRTTLFHGRCCRRHVAPGRSTRINRCRSTNNRPVLLVSLF